MSTKHVQDGFAITVTLAAAAASNELIKVGDLAGVCLNSGVIGESIEVAIDEVFEVAKLSTDGIAQGAIVYLDAANKHVTLATASGANIRAGKAVKAAAAATTTVQI
ncbi:MAG: DUF2190 family protein, partial [Dongiaceae bacterium]